MNSRDAGAELLGKALMLWVAIVATAYTVAGLAGREDIRVPPTYQQGFEMKEDFSGYPQADIHPQLAGDGFSSGGLPPMDQQLRNERWVF